MTETKHDEIGAINSVPKELHIDGQWRPGASTFAVEDPSTGKVLCRVADADADQGLAALDAAARAQGEWAATPPRERAEILRRAFSIMTEETERLALIMTLELSLIHI